MLLRLLLTRTMRGVMLNWTVTFLLVAIVAGAFGFGGIAAEATGVARILFLLFLVLFVFSFITGRKTLPPLDRKRQRMNSNHDTT